MCTCSSRSANAVVTHLSAVAVHVERVSSSALVSGSGAAATSGLSGAADAVDDACIARADVSVQGSHVTDQGPRWSGLGHVEVVRGALEVRPLVVAAFHDQPTTCSQSCRWYVERGDVFIGKCLMFAQMKC